jgi:hypothetical protein
MPTKVKTVVNTIDLWFEITPKRFDAAVAVIKIAASLPVSSLLDKGLFAIPLQRSKISLSGVQIQSWSSMKLAFIKGLPLKLVSSQ